MYLYAKDPHEAKYQFLVPKLESTCIKHFNDFIGFIEYWNHMDDFYKYIEECNSNKKSKLLIVFDDMIADMLNNKRNLVVTESFIRGRKLYISLVFVAKWYFAVWKYVRLNSTRYFIKKTPNKWELIHQMLTLKPYESI